MSLYNEYRPKEFSEVYGQDSAVKLLESILQQPFQKRPKVFLMAGPSGSGKTCLAYIYSRKMNCPPEGFDFRTLDASKDRSIDRIRAEVDLMGSSPMNKEAESRVWLIDECFTYDTVIACYDKNRDATYYTKIGYIVKEKREVYVWSMRADGFLEPKPVTGWFDNGLKHVCTYTFDKQDGECGDWWGACDWGGEIPFTITCTPNHKVFRAHDLSEVEVGSLMTGEEVVLEGKYGPFSGRLKSVTTNTSIDTGILVPVYDIEVADNHNYIANGVVAHNCHQLLTTSQEALLKVCEEAPPKTTIIFATTLPEKLGSALKSRCKTITLNALSNKDMANNMLSVAKRAGIEVGIEDIKKLVLASEGNTRVSMQLLENYSLNGHDVDAAVAMASGACSKLVADTYTLCRAIINRNSDWSMVKDFMGVYKGQHEAVRQAILGYLKACILSSKTAKDRQRFTMLIECFVTPFYGNEEAGLVYQLATAWDTK